MQILITYTFCHSSSANVSLKNLLTTTTKAYAQCVVKPLMFAAFWHIPDPPTDSHHMSNTPTWPTPPRLATCICIYTYIYFSTSINLEPIYFWLARDKNQRRWRLALSSEPQSQTCRPDMYLLINLHEESLLVDMNLRLKGKYVGCSSRSTWQSMPSLISTGKSMLSGSVQSTACCVPVRMSTDQWFQQLTVEPNCNNYLLAVVLYCFPTIHLDCCAWTLWFYEIKIFT